LDDEEDDESDVSIRSSDEQQVNEGPDGPRTEDDIEDVEYIGPITAKQRYSKVKNYLEKKYNKAFSQKYVYACRKQVAEKRLRIKGRFVTKTQAFEILGLTEGQLLDNAKIQELLTQYAESPMQVNSLIDDGTGQGQMIKVSNF